MMSVNQYQLLPEEPVIGASDELTQIEDQKEDLQRQLKGTH